MPSVIVAALLLVGCGRSVEPQPAPKAPPTVRIAIVQAATTPPQIEAIGTAVWRRETPLGFTSDGQIARILVNEGDVVRRGQLLAILDTTAIGAELAAAQAESRRAQAEANRLNQLYGKGWVTKQRLETAQAGAQASAAQSKARQFALRTAQVTAPSAGVVLARLAEPTQVIAKGTPVLVIGESDGGYVMRVPVNDRVAAALRLGAPATVRFEALGAAPLQGRILEIGGRARQATGTFDVEIGLPNAPGLRSGMIGTATLAAVARRSLDTIVLPAIAVLSPRAGEGLVYVVDANSRASLRQVALGETRDTGVEILSGIKAGDRVILSGFDKIRNGVRVTPALRAP